MDALLSMKHISKSFPGVRALDDVQFEVNRGEVHALIGENGAGKSTLMKVLTGIYRADAGEIMFKGKPWQVKNPKEAQDRGISIIHQEFNLMPDLTVAENIFVAREPARRVRFMIDEKRMYREAQRLIDGLGVNIRPGDIVADLSVAQKQMVEIIKALAVKSDLLVLDEPTSALAEEEVQTLFGIIRRLRAENVGIVYISHRLEEFSQIVDRVTVLRDGCYIETRDWKNTTIDQLITLMVGRSITEQYPKRSAKIGDVVLEAKGFSRGSKLKNASLTVRRGEILGVAGLMGAGRTEFARAIFGAGPIDSGELFIAGKRVTVHSPGDAIANGIAYLPEDRKQDGLFLDKEIDMNILSVYLKMYARYGVIDAKACENAVQQKIRELRIKTPSAKQIAQNLSGGNQQKVLIARWLCRDATVMIFDEPTRGIDVGAKYEVYSLMNEAAERGLAVVMISSDMSEILGMSDRILVMCEGNTVGELAIGEASQERILQMASNLK